jgi:trk system potassium uptake protein TrkH
MNPLAVLHEIGAVLTIVGAALAACAGIGRLLGDPLVSLTALCGSAALSLLLGGGLRLTTRRAPDLTIRDGIGVVTFSWAAIGIVGALPYIWSGVIPDLAGAVFETISGFTTTGASVIPVPELVPRGILLWRATTHFLGGMGVLLLCIAILPALGAGGMQLYRAEVTGPFKDRITPRLADTARLLWWIYVALCAAETVMLRLGGMGWFDAVCHSFATLATGGFSTRTESIAAYHSLYIEGVVVFFMFVGACNFVLHHRLLRRGEVGGYARDTEFRFFAGFLAFVVAAITLNLCLSGGVPAGRALRESLFSVTSLMSTTGFCTADFDRWTPFAKVLLVLSMVVGGCVGSTSGGIKQLRIVVTMKALLRRVQQFYQPQAVISVKVNGESMPDRSVTAMVAFVALYVMLLVVASAIMTLFTPDMMTAVTSVVATVGGVGPGLGAVGPVQNYAFLPTAGKGVLILCMLFGRLEIFTLLALATPRFWRR